jgi:hypothetical protein
MHLAKRPDELCGIAGLEGALVERGQLLDAVGSLRLLASGALWLRHAPSIAQEGKRMDRCYLRLRAIVLEISTSCWHFLRASQSLFSEQKRA